MRNVYSILNSPDNKVSPKEISNKYFPFSTPDIFTNISVGVKYNSDWIVSPVRILFTETVTSVYTQSKLIDKAAASGLK